MAENKLEELSNKITMFKNGFEAITGNIEKQLVKVESEVNSLVDNTKAIPKIRTDNKEIFKQMSAMSGTLGELIRRLDKLDSM